ncbi:CocE/NonD family hydrolase [Microbacterium sp.]|jgi:predicted acyl esterase|uniref:CocE/NonD family hydrolase n=1 Tax=Microbacterium sp. TaxID=51671 RepID=UPI0037C96576
MTLRSRIVGMLGRLPRRTAAPEVQRSVPTRTRDDVVLLSDVWLPRPLDSSSALVLIRTPYGRDGMDLLARLLAERGHPVVVQSCRGTFGSGGQFEPFGHELEDGADTLAWLADQPWADRPISVLGASYFGHTAYSVIAADPGRVSSAAAAVTATDMHAAAVYPDGVFAPETALMWIAGLITQELPPFQRWHTIRRIRRRMPAALDAAPAEADGVLLDGKTYAPYRDWVRYDDPRDPWWDPLRRGEIRAAMPPSTLVAGWYDPFVVGQLADVEAIASAGRDVRLVVGPWTHGSPAIATTVIREGLHLLAGAGRGGATVWDEGLSRWVELDAWPPPAIVRSLVLDVDAALRLEPRGEVDLVWQVDPADSPPAAGGRGLNPDFAGRRRQHARERRDDVKVFTTHVLRHPLTIAGRASLRIVTDDVEAHAQDWFVRLCDVSPRGVSRNVSDGFVRAAAGETAVTVSLAPAAFTFRPGHRVRVQIAGTGHPFHPRPVRPEHRRLLSTVAARSVLDLPVVVDGWGAAGATVTRRIP